MDQWQQISSQFRVFFQQLPNFLVLVPWAWWAAGIGIGLTAVALASCMGKKLGVTGGFEDACSVVTGNEKDFTPSESHWKLWFILGLPLGGLLANFGHLGWTIPSGEAFLSFFSGPGLAAFFHLIWKGVTGYWTLTYGRLDEITFGNMFWKGLWLLVSGVMIGFGARWAGGCVSGNSIMGISLGSKMAILATVGFLVAGILITNILYKVF